MENKSCTEVLVMNDLFSYYIVGEVVLHVCATILLHLWWKMFILALETRPFNLTPDREVYICMYSEECSVLEH